MPTNRRFRKKKQTGVITASPSTLAVLAEDGDLDAIVSLAIRIGNPPFDALSEDERGIAEGIAILRRLWPQHHKAATEYCIRRNGAGTRPELWWSGKSRTFVEPRDWNSPEDAVRYARARAAADLEYLRAHGYLTKAEKLQIEEAKKEREFGPTEEDENETT
jgi:hypothetical protein